MQNPASVSAIARARRTVSRPAPSATPPLDRIAFLGTAQGAKVSGESIQVQSLCWPMVPTAWSDLTHAWQRLRELRSESPYASTPDSRSSWVAASAPQLATPFRGTTAEESSVAALLTRTPIRIAISLITTRRSGEPAAPSGSWQQALSACLAIYHEFVRWPARRPCTLFVCRHDEEVTDRQLSNAFHQCRARTPEATWLASAQARVWSESIEPLALELAHLVAASVLRHQLEPSEPNAIFDTVLTKLAPDPSGLRFGTSGRKPVTAKKR